MQISPGFLGCFSQADSTKMREIFVASFNQLPKSAQSNDAKCRLASIVIYICQSEKQAGDFLQSDNVELANEALQVLLASPQQADRSRFADIITNYLPNRSR